MKKLLLLIFVIPIIFVACQKSPETSTQEIWSASGINIQSWSVESPKEVYFSNDCIGLKMQKPFTEWELESGWIFFWKTDNISEITGISKFNQGWIHGITIDDWKKLENGIMAYMAEWGTYDYIPQPRYLVLHKGTISVIIYISSDTQIKAYDIYEDYLKTVESYGKNECKEIKTGDFVSYATIEKYIKDNMPEPAIKIDIKKPFEIDEYFKKWTYTVIKKEKKGIYNTITVNPESKTNSGCTEMAWSFCVNFVLKNNKLIYTNLAKVERYEDYSSIKEDIWELYSMTLSGAIFENTSWGEGECSGGNTSYLTYMNFESGKRIYQDYTEWWECVKEGKKDNNESCDSSTCKKKETKTKIFYNLPVNDKNRKKLDLKATNLEDAYLEYYKEWMVSGDDSVQYENKDFWISFRYPKGWIITENKGDMLDIHVSNFQHSDNNEDCDKDYIWLEFQVGRVIAKNKIWESYDMSDLKDCNFGCMWGSITQIEIQGHIAYKWENSWWSSACKWPGYGIKETNNTYTYIYTGTSNKTGLETIEKIVQSIGYTK